MKEWGQAGTAKGETCRLCHVFSWCEGVGKELFDALVESLFTPFAST